MRIPPLHQEFQSPLQYSSLPVSPARPQLSQGISRTTRQTTYELFTPSNSGQRSHPTYYRGCWHVVGRCFFSTYRHPQQKLRAAPMVKEVYNPKAVIPHAASLHQACAHCAIFPTAASRRSLGRISVPVWPDTLSGRLPVVALVGHHPTNKLIGRGPIPHPKSFPPPGHATSRVYSVLDPVSQAYPKVQGRSPTCYSPVRHSSTPERAFPFDLHVLSTPPAFVLSQNQTLQTKTSHTPKRAQENSNQNNLITAKRHQKLASKKQNHTPTREMKRHGQKQQQNKTTKHTIEFSNNTPPAAQQDPRLKPLTRSCGRRRKTTEVVLPSGHRRARRAYRVAATQLSYATGNLESNSLIEG